MCAQLSGHALDTSTIVRHLTLIDPSREDRDLIRSVLAGLEEGEYRSVSDAAGVLVGIGISLETAVQTVVDLKFSDRLVDFEDSLDVNQEDLVVVDGDQKINQDAYWDLQRREACVIRTIDHWRQTGSWPSRGDIARADGITDKEVMASGRYHTVLANARQRVESPPRADQAETWEQDPFDVSEVNENGICEEVTLSGDRLLTVTGRIVTVEQLTALMNIDPERWEIETITGNKWEGLQAGGEHTTELIQVKFIARRKPFNALDAARELLRDVPRLPPLRRAVQPDGLMMALGLVDLHVGKLSIPEATGDVWNLALAEQVALEATQVLLTRARNAGEIARILLPWGHDLIHTEDGRMTTRGTPQDVAELYHAVNLTALRISQQVIELCRDVAPVDVVMVTGNHARRSEWWLGEVLRARYANSEGISVNNSTRARKYVAWEGILLGLTHGDGPKHSALPALMAQEAGAAWSGAHTREWLIGHLHHTKVLSQRLVIDAQDHVGVTIRQLPTVCGSDVWHEAAGYVGATKRVEAPLYHRSEGYIHSVCYTRPQTQSPPNNVIHVVTPERLPAEPDPNC